MTKKPRCRVILIDSDRRWREMAAAYLRDAKIESMTYPDLDAVVNSLKGTEHIPTLIFINVTLAEASGDKFRLLADQEAHPLRYTIALFPTRLTIPVMTQLFKMGAYDCIDKPYDRTSLVSIVNTFIDEIQENSRRLDNELVNTVMSGHLAAI